jgi:DNA-binding LacI/PurR family transcriptional regulator
LRERVNEAVQTLNYQPNRTARNLRQNKTSKIGVLISDILNPFFASMIHGIEKALTDQDYSLILGNSGEDPHQEKKLLSMLVEENVAGIIFVPTNIQPDNYLSLSRRGIPSLVVDREIPQPGFDTVLVDSFVGSSQAVEYLVRLGHRRIAYIGGLDYLSNMQERLAGYRDGLLHHGISLFEPYLTSGNNRQDGGYQAMYDLLRLAEPPSAVLVANNLMTLGALQAIHEAGVKIPDEISMIGFDDMDWAPSLSPPLTVIAQPVSELGRTAVRLLLERIEEPQRPTRKILLDTTLIVRASCAPVLPTDEQNKP